MGGQVSEDVTSVIWEMMTRAGPDGVAVEREKNQDCRCLESRTSHWVIY